MNDFISTISAQLTASTFIHFFFKSFAVLFAFMYLIYAIVLVRQTQVMNRTLKTRVSWMLVVVGFVHIFLALLLIFLSLVLI